jgi:preprotein translocase subunit SecB
MSDASAATPPQSPAQSPAGAQGAQQQGPAQHTMAQYLKDLSFENPAPLESLTQPANASPNITVNVGVEAKAARDNGHEVTLSMRVQAVVGEKTIFLVEASYCGLFALVNIPQENHEAILHVHCPSLLFPFARQIVADAVRDGGFPPLYLNMVDFASIWQQQQAQKAGGGTMV